MARLDFVTFIQPVEGRMGVWHECRGPAIAKYHTSGVLKYAGRCLLQFTRPEACKTSVPQRLDPSRSSAGEGCPRSLVFWLLLAKFLAFPGLVMPHSSVCLSCLADSQCLAFVCLSVLVLSFFLWFVCFFLSFGHAPRFRDLSSQTKDWTWAPTGKAQNPNHWATRELTPILF